MYCILGLLLYYSYIVVILNTVHLSAEDTKLDKNTDNIFIKNYNTFLWNPRGKGDMVLEKGGLVDKRSFSFICLKKLFQL